MPEATKMLFFKLQTIKNLENKLQEISERYPIVFTSVYDSKGRKKYQRNSQTQEDITRHLNTLNQLQTTSTKILFTSTTYSPQKPYKIPQIKKFISRIEKIETEYGKGTYFGTALTSKEKAHLAKIARSDHSLCRK